MIDSYQVPEELWRILSDTPVGRKTEVTADWLRAQGIQVSSSDVIMLRNNIPVLKESYPTVLPSSKIEEIIDQ